VGINVSWLWKPPNFYFNQLRSRGIKSFKGFREPPYDVADGFLTKFFRGSLFPSMYISVSKFFFIILWLSSKKFNISS